MKLLDPLQENKQLKLFKEYEQGKSQAIREKLILHNLKLVAWTIKRYYDTNILEYDDYFQIGAIGLMKAIVLIPEPYTHLLIIPFRNYLERY